MSCITSSTHNLLKAFKAFKGVINLVYDYAIRNEKYEIIKNPRKAMDNNNCFSYCKNTTSSRKAKNVMYTTKQMDTIVSTFKSRVNYKPYNGYYIPYFAARLQRATGERPGELFALKWSDIVQTENGALLSITRSQIEHRYLNGKKQQWYEIIESTKDEKGVSKGGREFPITNEINEILMDIRNAQMKNNIHSEYIICDRNGEMCTKKVYFDAFTSVCKSLGYPLLGSYTFRRELNSKLERAGLESSDRAALLGHSVQTNEKWYTFAEHGVVDRGRQALNETASESSKSVENVTYHTKIVSFGERRKARNPIVSGISH